MKGTRFYKIYGCINERCTSNIRKDYHSYRGRGIKNLWSNFLDFKRDMYKSYIAHVKKFGEKNTSLDRIDNNGNYCKENCHWATNKIQARNKRTNIFIKYKGQSKCIAEWAEILGIHRQSLRYRLYHGWSIKNMIELPLKYSNKNGKART